jgi:hypothetical protein
MLTIEDFTKLPEGLVVALEGRVGRCPICGRNGIERVQTDGRGIYLHLQTSEILSDGLLIEPRDCCEVVVN